MTDDPLTPFRGSQQPGKVPMASPLMRPAPREVDTFTELPLVEDLITESPDSEAKTVEELRYQLGYLQATLDSRSKQPEDGLPPQGEPETRIAALETRASKLDSEIRILYMWLGLMTVAAIYGAFFIATKLL